MLKIEGIVLNSIAAACMAMLPAKAAAQSANDPISTVSEDDFLNAMSLIQPAVNVERANGGFTFALPNGIEAEARLQNCDDRQTLSNCRTVSIIVNLLTPQGKSREELLTMVNDLNKQDIHGRSFLNDRNQIITRWTFFATGNENSRGFVVKLINWDEFVRSATLSLYGDADG
ncbi:hypothetical protein [Erythrobacter sp. Alg231-14]|uniref:hypothetical protein n=1 Tax=Erythrobacter sp. Alg231-14 TaxID=1922225 RepID=UPI00307C84DE